MRKLLVVCAAGASLLGMHGPAQAGAADAQAALRKIRLKIMPLGDSITWGARDPGYGGYRHLLGKLLTDDGYSIDFVGSRKSGKGVIPDPDNEGHPGWTIPQIKNGIDANGWLERYKPDIILLHIGTNDLHHGDAASAPANLSALLDDILARLPQTRVIVAQIIPFRRGPDQAHQSYSAAIPAIAASKGSRVSTVDMQNILSPDDYADGIHPNASGYDKMARAWEGAIRAVVSRSGAQPTANAPPQSSVAACCETVQWLHGCGISYSYQRRLPLKLESEPAIERKASTANAPIRPKTTMVHLQQTTRGASAVPRGAHAEVLRNQRPTRFEKSTSCCPAETVSATNDSGPGRLTG